VLVVLELVRSAYVRRKMRILLAIEDWPDPVEVAETITSQGWPPDTEVRVLSVVTKGVPGTPSTSSAKKGQRAEGPANEMPKQIQELTTGVANILRANDLTAVVRFGPEARNWLKISWPSDATEVEELPPTHPRARPACRQRLHGSDWRSHG
jgi:hypothetical protein